MDNSMIDADLPLCVFDNSYMVSALLSIYCDDEDTDALDYVEKIVNNNGQIYVPQLFWFEFWNVLVTSTKRKNNGNDPRINQIQYSEIIQLIAKLPIYTDPQPDSETLQRIMAYAQEYGLSFYDATYLELAKRYNIPLKTFDEDLLKYSK